MDGSVGDKVVNELHKTKVNNALIEDGDPIHRGNIVYTATACTPCSVHLVSNTHVANRVRFDASHSVQS